MPSPALTTEQLLARVTADSTIQAVLGEAMTLGASLYLVGGAVRDLLLTGTLSADWDFMVINGSAEELARSVADGLQAHFVPLDPAFGIYRVVLRDGLYLDFADALENDRDRDLARRDVTINAIAIDLARRELLDPFDGLGDLQARRVRMVSDANLLDDPLRMLRVFRIAAGIRANEIDPATLAVVGRHADKIYESAAERIAYEFLRLLDSENSFPYIEAMADCGLLEEIFPEMRAMREIPPNGYHHLGLFEHTLELVRQAERLLSELPEASQEHLRQPFNGVVSRMAVVKLACLLHDLGKPATKALKEDGSRWTYYGHEQVSEEMGNALMRRLKLGNEIRETVNKLVRWHLYPCQFGPTSSRKAVLRFFRKIGEDTPDLLLLALADRHSAVSGEYGPELLAESHAAHLWLLERYHEETAVLTLPRLLDGRAVMELLDIPPGPKIRDVLNAMQEAHQLGEITSADEARTWVMQHFKGSP